MAADFAFYIFLQHKPSSLCVVQLHCKVGRSSAGHSKLCDRVEQEKPYFMTMKKAPRRATKASFIVACLMNPHEMVFRVQIAL